MRSHPGPIPSRAICSSANFTASVGLDSRPVLTRLRLLLCLIVLASFGAIGPLRADIEPGASLTSLLELLQQRGLSVVYSSQLVHDDMKVTTRIEGEPTIEQVRLELERHGFGEVREIKQFLMPMVVHRKGRGAAPLRALEVLFRAVGLTSLWGSPVILRAQRSRPAGTAS